MSTINDTIKWNCGTRILDKCSGILSNAEKFGLHLQVDSSRIDDVVDDRSADDHFHKSTKDKSEVNRAIMRKITTPQRNCV